MWNWMSAAGRPERRAHEGAHLGDGGGQRPGAAQHPLGHGLRPVGAVERVLVADLEEHGHERVVLEVVARRRAGRGGRLDARPGGARRRARCRTASAAAASRSRRPRGPPRARRGPRACARPRPGVAHARRAAALDSSPSACAPVTTSRLRPAERGPQVRVGGAPAPAALLGDLEHRRAVLLGPVVVVDAGMPAASAAARNLAFNGRGERCSRHVERPAVAVELRRAALVVLGLAGSTGRTSSQPQPVAPAASQRS